MGRIRYPMTVRQLMAFALGIDADASDAPNWGSALAPAYRYAQRHGVAVDADGNALATSGDCVGLLCDHPRHAWSVAVADDGTVDADAEPWRGRDTNGRVVFTISRDAAHDFRDRYAARMARRAARESAAERIDA